jgi:signal transduction histidine kinase
VVDVLIDNVFAHTDEGVPVEIWVVPRADGAVVLTVEDAGSGLPSVDVINRGRSNAGSTGLGLDIVRRAALASGGSLELGRSRLGGALVRLVLGRADD